MCRTQIDRWYWRCTDCLGVAAVDGRCAAPKCPCGGMCECMGQVSGYRLTSAIHLCPCDGRCTGATGPSCECQCGGENHGTGAVVRVIVDRGPVPELDAADAAERSARGEAYRHAVTAIEDELDRLYAARLHRRASDAAYMRERKIQRVANELRKSRTMAGRAKLIAHADTLLGAAA